MTTRQTLDLLRRYECRNTTFIEPDGSWPIVWKRARGVHVWDADGRRYLDLTAAFGVANAGHANPAVVAAGRNQMRELVHAMGDVHPHALKARLARELSRVTFERWSGPRRTTGKTLFSNSGFEAVESALKTARLATGKPGILAFHGGYHGLGYGALNATHRPHFREPFLNQLREFGQFAPYPETGKPASLVASKSAVEAALRSGNIGAVLLEPIQARGGIRIPPPDFLPWLRQACDRHGALLILDEIYTGFGRTGKWFACEHTRTVPDLVCVGKALTGGFPMSACIGQAELMDSAWPPSAGEAIHTSTFLGHPVGCAMALAQIDQLRSRRLGDASARLGRELLAALDERLPKDSRWIARVRGVGLMVGIEFQAPDGTPATGLVIALMKSLLQAGFIVLPEGEHSNVLGLTPPLTISARQLRTAVEAISTGLSCSQSATGL